MTQKKKKNPTQCLLPRVERCLPTSEPQRRWSLTHLREGVCGSVLFKKRFTQQRYACREQSQELKSQAVKSDQAECFLSARNRKHSHSLSSVTRNTRENFFTFSLQSGVVTRTRRPQQSKSVAGGEKKALRWFLFLYFHLLFKTTKIDPSQKRLVNCELPAYGRAQKGPGILGCGGSPVLQGDPRGRDTEEKQQCWRSLPCTSLALNVSVQLCADFFLRKSCGSRNNDSRSLPPLVTIEIWKLHHSSTGAIVFSRLSLNWDSQPPPQKNDLSMFDSLMFDRFFWCDRFFMN